MPENIYQDSIYDQLINKDDLSCRFVNSFQVAWQEFILINFVFGLHLYSGASVA